MKNVVVFFAIIVSVGLPVRNAIGSSTYTGTVVDIVLYTEQSTVANMVGVKVVSANINNRASCASGETAHYVFDGSTSVGKNTYAAFLTAYITGRDVFISGQDTCFPALGMEQINYMKLK